MSEAAPADERPLGAYAALTSVHVLGISVAAFAIDRRGRMPERIDWQDLALIAVATQKLARDITHDKVTAWIRAPFARYQGKGEPGEEDNAVVGTGLRRAIGQLLVCPFCLGEWIGASFVIGHALAPKHTRFVASIVAIHGVADALQIAYVAASERRTPRPSA